MVTTLILLALFLLITVVDSSEISNTLMTNSIELNKYHRKGVREKMKTITPTLDSYFKIASRLISANTISCEENEAYKIEHTY